MTKQNDQIDWSDFNETEQQAIAIDGENMINGTDRPTFPYSATAFEEMAETLASLAAIMPNSAFRMANELTVINNVLLKLLPLPPTQDQAELAALLTEDEIKRNILACNVCHFLIKQFSNIADQILAAQTVAKH